MTAPITRVLELIEKEPSTFPIVAVLDAIDVTQGEVPCCTAPIFIVDDDIEKDPRTLPIVCVLEAMEVTQGEVPC